MVPPAWLVLIVLMWIIAGILAMIGIIFVSAQALSKNTSASALIAFCFIGAAILGILSGVVYLIYN
ncbi:MAG: hypothetical protein U0796_06100 [Gemmatales bacterium]